RAGTAVVFAERSHRWGWRIIDPPSLELSRREGIGSPRSTSNRRERRSPPLPGGGLPAGQLIDRMLAASVLVSGHPHARAATVRARKQILVGMSRSSQYVVTIRTRPRRSAGAQPPAGEDVEPVRRWGPRAAAVAAGALPVLAFPAPALWWLAWFGLVPWLMLLVRGFSAREAAIRAWFGAAGFLFGMHYWLCAQ